MFSAYKIIPIVCLTTLVAGCAEYRPEPISATAEAASLEERTLKTPRLQEFIGIALPSRRKSAPASTWDLAKLTLAALYYHPDLDIARAKLLSTRAGIVTAAQIPNPTVSASAVYNATVTTPTPWTVGQVINFLIETMGKREYRTAQAQNLAEAARDDLATATWWHVRGQVRTALLNLWASERRLALINRRLSLQQQLVDLLQRRFAEALEYRDAEP
jgi:cobalt-zinc-cadmium efflux system outer membrane protein